MKISFWGTLFWDQRQSFFSERFDPFFSEELSRTFPPISFSRHREVIELLSSAQKWAQRFPDKRFPVLEKNRDEICSEIRWRRFQDSNILNPPPNRSIPINHTPTKNMKLVRFLAFGNHDHFRDSIIDGIDNTSHDSSLIDQAQYLTAEMTNSGAEGTDFLGIKSARLVIFPDTYSGIIYLP